MARMSFLTELGRHLADPESHTLRRALTGLWVLSILGVLVLVGQMSFSGGAPALQARTHETLADYAIPAGLSFMSQDVDASLGMGYGTSLTALLVMMGFSVREVVIAVLVQQLIAGGLAAIMHHALGNADLRPGHFHFKLAMVLGSVAIVGSFAAASLAVSLPEGTLGSALGAVILAMGLIIFIARRIQMRFSWWRAGVLGLVAGANKGFMGGGYGPLIVAGQVISGDTMRHAVAVTAASEALSCVGGVAGYLLMGVTIPWMLTGSLVVGGILASVFAAATVRSLPLGAFKSVVAVMYIILGGLMLRASLG